MAIPTSKAQPNRRRRRVSGEQKTAYHEAGHAVARHFCKRAARFRYVTIKPGEGSLGHLQTHPTPSLFEEGRERRLPLDRVVDEMKCALAGCIAEKRAVKRYNHVGAEADRTRAINLAQFYTGGDSKRIGAFVHWIWLETEALVETKWWAVEAVTQRLLKRKRLTAKAVHETIREAEEREIARRTAKSTGA